MMIAWTIAGSDSGGGAGIQADLHTFQAMKVHGCSVITAVTAQNTVSVEDIFYLPAQAIIQQIKALQHDLTPQAIKIGMIGKSENISYLQTFLASYTGKVVLDPVMVAGSGDVLFQSETDAYAQALSSLYPYIDLITPNISEAEVLSGMNINNYQDVEKAAEILLSKGIKNILIKGGHFKDDQFSQDYWTDGTEHFWLSSKRLSQQACHGTGCTLSSAIAALLACNIVLKEALVMAKMYISQGLTESRQCGAGSLLLGHGPVRESQDYLPYLTKQPLAVTHPSFPPLLAPPAIYPIVDHAHWLEILLPLGIRTIQLRIKDKTRDDLESQIQQSVAIAEKYHAQLFINDYWELAIKHKAYGVHLGQEDLMSVNIQKIRDAGLRLGLSTHSYEELATAHAYHPSYVAFGPIFPTTSKQMPFSPQGLARLEKIRRCVNYPLVAIGGIGVENMREVASVGVDGVAMISAITQAENPVQAVKELMDLWGTLIHPRENYTQLDD